MSTGKTEVKSIEDLFQRAVINWDAETWRVYAAAGEVFSRDASSLSPLSFELQRQEKMEASLELAHAMGEETELLALFDGIWSLERYSSPVQLSQLFSLLSVILKHRPLPQARIEFVEQVGRLLSSREEAGFAIPTELRLLAEKTGAWITQN